MVDSLTPTHLCIPVEAVGNFGDPAGGLAANAPDTSPLETQLALTRPRRLRILRNKVVYYPNSSTMNAEEKNESVSDALIFMQSWPDCLPEALIKTGTVQVNTQ